MVLYDAPALGSDTILLGVGIPWLAGRLGLLARRIEHLRSTQQLPREDRLPLAEHDQPVEPSDDLLEAVVLFTHGVAPTFHLHSGELAVILFANADIAPILYA